MADANADGELEEFDQAGTETGKKKLNAIVKNLKTAKADIAELKKGKSTKLFAVCEDGFAALYLLDYIKTDGPGSEEE